MSTRAIIAKTSYRYGHPFTNAVHVLHDGDPPITGWILHHYYNDETVIDQLLNNSDLARLGITPDARPYLHDRTPHGLETIAYTGPGSTPGYRQPGHADDMMKTDWFRHFYPDWYYLRVEGPWLARDSSSVFQPLTELHDKCHVPIAWPFAASDGSIRYRDKNWILANLPPN